MRGHGRRLPASRFPADHTLPLFSAAGFRQRAGWARASRRLGVFARSPLAAQTTGRDETTLHTAPEELDGNRGGLGSTVGSCWPTALSCGEEQARRAAAPESWAPAHGVKVNAGASGGVYLFMAHTVHRPSSCRIERRTRPCVGGLGRAHVSYHRTARFESAISSSHDPSGAHAFDTHSPRCASHCGSAPQDAAEVDPPRRPRRRPRRSP